ncbi:hypothetical protein TcCL_ESM09997 [Trypanosoma cruzi]|nr:hypothetical protein TcCL_ESM09997 [Trypanosoma cruzi]
MHCISLSSLCLKQTLTFSQSTAWELRVAAERCHVSEDPNVRKQRPPSLTQLSRTQGRCHGKEKPAAQQMHNDTCNSRATDVAPQDRAMRTAQTRRQREGRGTSKCIPQSFTSPFPGGLASHTHK